MFVDIERFHVIVSFGYADADMVDVVVFLVLWYSGGLLIGRLAASNEKNDVTHESILAKLARAFKTHLPHQVDGDSDERDENASNPNHG